MKFAREALLFTALTALFALAQGCGGDEGTTPLTTPEVRQPLVIGHRGASGYLPEHTLESYALAIEQGADFVEPDLVMTSDGYLIARHEPVLTDTTDVADRMEFASRETTRMVDGVEITGWFASDFTLAEIKDLRAIQPRTYRPQEFNGQYAIPTFDEVIALVEERSQATGRTIGIYPETKHPTYHTDLGLPLEDALLDALAARGWTTADAPVFIQSFEVSNLQYMRERTQVRLVQLVDADSVDLDGGIVLAAPYDKPYDFAVGNDPRTFVDLLTDEGLAFIKGYADGVGPWKRYIVSTAGADADGDGMADDVNADGAVDEADRTVLPPGDLIARVHAAGLTIHTWTFRSEAQFLGADYGGDPAKEYRQLYELGIDGVFSDFPDHAVSAREP
jgi:glycerophosphoryl diester phosphodiesterase